jgi:serine/threonine protein kinase
MQPWIDRILSGRYQITQFLGEGGMGGVYRAVDLTLQRDVAVKIMHPRLAENSQIQQRFRQEAQIAARLSHPNIVRVHDFGQDGELFYIAMELILGDNLRQMMHKLRRQRQWIVLAEALQLVQHLALALEYAHRHGVLHRDIKPANIMIKDEAVNGLPYQPIVTDLGLAKIGGSTLQTQAGSTMGTPAYMSPEQTLGQEMDARSDVYSLGVLLYELVAAHTPFPIKNLTEAIRYHTQEMPPPLQKIRPDLPIQIEAIVARTLAKDPVQRFSSAGELAQALALLPGNECLDTVPPLAINGASSFRTCYEQSSIELHNDSLLERAPGAANHGDHLEIVDPGRQKQTVEIQSRRLTLGRHSGNDIVLAEQIVSRHHAQIEFDGKRYTITDLGSANGTYKDRNRLYPNSATPWKGDEPVRIGNHYLILRCGSVASQAAANPKANAAPPTPPVANVEKPVVGVALIQSAQSVEPGGSLRAEVIVVNRGTAEAKVRVEIKGIPSTWILTAPVTVVLPPQQRSSHVFYIRPTRQPQTQPGRHLLEVAVYAYGEKTLVAASSGPLNVQSFTQFESSLTANPKGKSAAHAVNLHHQGNTVQRYTITWQAEPGTLFCDPERIELQLAPDQSETRKVQVHVRRRHLFRRRYYPMVAHIRADSGPIQSHPIEIPASAWLFQPVVLVSLFLLAGISAGVWFLLRYFV